MTIDGRQEEYTHCLGSCYGDAPAVEGNECVSTCSSEMYANKGSQMTCVSECSGNTFRRNGTMNECVDACLSTEYFVISGDKKYCYESCPEYFKFNVDGSRECRSCSDEAPYWTGTDCVT